MEKLVGLARAIGHRLAGRVEWRPRWTAEEEAQVVQATEDLRRRIGQARG